MTVTGGIAQRNSVLRWRALRWGAAVLLFGLLFWLVDPGELLTTLSHADLSLILALAGLSVVWLFLGALNVWILLRRLGTIPLASFAGVYLLSWSMSLLIPGQLGDATQIVLLRRYGIEAARSAAAYVIDKSLSLGMFVLIGAYGVMRFAGDVSLETAFFVLLAGVLLAAGLVFGVVAVAPRSWFPQRLREFRKSFYTSVTSFADRPALVGLNAAISIVKWLVMAAMYYIAFAASSVFISFESAATIPVVSSLVAYVPITIAGIGTMEWTAIGLFDSVGVSPVAVVGAYVIMRGVLIACAAFMLSIRSLSQHARSR